MDALALLCTLHADGPSSLKRLRSRGCGDLSTLLARTPDAVAEDLAIERPAARRLIREARLLADRVGITALEVEEAPPAAEPAPPARSLVQESPRGAAPEASAPNGLDHVDRALVERITRPAPTRPEPSSPDGPNSDGPNSESPRPETETPAASEEHVEESPAVPIGKAGQGLPGWLDGPAVPHADDPFSVPGADFGPEAAAPEGGPDAAEGVPAECVANPLPELEPVNQPEPATAEEVGASAPPPADVTAEAAVRDLQEPSDSPEPEAQPLAPLAFGAAVFGDETPEMEAAGDEPAAESLGVAPMAARDTDRGTPPAEPSAVPEPSAASESLATPEPAEVHEAASVPEPSPSSEPTVEPTAEPAGEVGPAPIPAIATEVAAASSAALVGMDEALVEDLERLGVTSFAELCTAESLALTRGLGITFGQARRLRFLARRAEAEGSSWPSPSRSESPAAESPAAESPAADGLGAQPAPSASEKMEVAEPLAPLAFAAEVFGGEPAEEGSLEEAPATDAPAPGAMGGGTAAREPLPFAAAIDPEWEEPSQIETESAPAESSAESAPERPAELAAPATAGADLESLGEAGTGPLDEPEPVKAMELEPQGVRVDPSEVKARPRFGDQFAIAAQQRRTASQPGRTVLGWNFEIPRPEPEALPLASLSATPMGEDEGAGTDADGSVVAKDDPGGPFAGA
ncbi:MAG: hypothetical protein P8R46_12605 [Planctomycetota bacterium]|nr:hypothetical protein [Planctomycetota bacterium]